MDIIETTPPPQNERTVLIGVQFRASERWLVEDHLLELAQLTESAGATVVATEIVKRGKASPATYIGSGKLEEIKLICADEDATAVIFDDDLTPAQQRNIEKIIDVKILDRTELILDIFAQRAQTREAQLQIELAQLQYMLPRLTRQWTHLSKQLGGIGTRGPGETQLEVDRRRVREKIHRLNNQIANVRQHRETQRKGRKRYDDHTAALIGYTNAGKSTLLNALTGAQVLIADKLFATLDPKTRKLVLPNNMNLLISDTVGFLRKLPHHLIDSFRATFEESAEADLLIHVIDISHPQAEEQSNAVYQVLEELKITDKPIITVLNKIDAITSESVITRYKNSHPNCVPVSALQNLGLDTLNARLASAFSDVLTFARMRIPQKESHLIHQIYKDGHVLARKYIENDILLDAELPARLLAKAREFILIPEAQELTTTPTRQS